MGVNQSPAYLSIAFQDVAKSIKDDQLQWFLQYLQYLDDLQIGISGRELWNSKTKLTFKTRSCPGAVGTLTAALM